MAKFIDLTGRRFGRLTVISRAGTDKSGKNPTWNCVCDCGNETISIGNNLRRGLSQSCGCLRIEHLIEASTNHGYASKETINEYNIWLKIKYRCYNESDIHYEYYGGRGIGMCDEWKNSFETFLSDMGRRPSLKYSIDRIDVNGNYEPSNCRWATKEQQERNKRISKNNITGVNGVSIRKDTNKYQARISIGHKNISLGCFDTLEEATKARKQAEQKYWND